MKAIRYFTYGSSDVLELRDIDVPDIGDDGVLVRVRAAAVNPLDFHFMRGTPYLIRAQAGLRRPAANGLGADLAGQVEAVGKNVNGFQPGDEVFGGSEGTFAEYVRIREGAAVITKPANLTFEQAASVPVAAVTALQALRDKGHVRAGQKVLINGAAGGVGTFAVQIARALGAEVTGVCSTRNVDMVSSIGADYVIDYTLDDYTRTGQAYDLIIDMVGNHTLADNRRVLEPRATLVGVGGPDNGRWIGPLSGPVKMVLMSPLVSQKLAPMLAHLSRDDLDILRKFLEEGKIIPVIDRRYPLSEVPAAIRYLEEGHARGKVVIAV